MIQEEMEMTGAVRVRDAEAAQQTIVTAIRKLEESGEIVLARGEEEELVG